MGNLRSIHRFVVGLFLSVLATHGTIQAQTNQSFDMNHYNVVWTSPSKNASESMPCGGGDIGTNVWVEQGDVMLYLSRSGAFDENGVLPKFGRVRIRLNPNPFTEGQFKQTLFLAKGYVEINGKNRLADVTIRVWVDVFNPVVHVETESKQAIQAEAIYESWRYQERTWSGVEFKASPAYTNAPIKPVTYPDSVQFRANDLFFYHRNRPVTLFDMTVHQQGLDSLKAQLWNPLAGLTFGGCMQGDNMRPDGAERGRYANTDFKGWRLKTVGAVRKWHLRVFLYRGQTTSADDGLHQIDQLVRRVRREETSSFARTQTWWQAYWKRSYIAINTERPDSASTAWQIGRNYNLFRYQLGCNAYGNFPTKFNGGLFTFDAVYVQPDYLTTPDHRNWGGSAFTAQNQRLVYYPMLKSGDFDLITPQLDFYRNSLGNAELRTAIYWKHKGASFTEQMELFGLPVASEYSWQRPSNYPPGVEYNPWLEYLWDTSLEFCLIALDKQRYNGDDITTYIPLIESCLTFFDEHYQQEALKRTPKALDGNGKLVLFPGSAAETYKGTYNASSTIAGLRVVLERLLALPPSYLSEPQRTHWTGMLQRIPTLPIRVKNGHRVIAPAEAWNRKQNVELPQLYPVYPWGLYGLNKPDLQTAIDTWLYGADSTDQKNHVSWHQDAIFCARLGLTEEAARIETQKMKNSPRRYPTFWGPGHDWVPDHNWGGTGMIGLQEMLMQESEGKIYLFPAWPPEWDVHFKLHAPGQTTVSGTLKNGHLTNLVVNPAVRRKDIIISPDAGIKMDNPSNK